MSGPAPFWRVREGLGGLRHLEVTMPDYTTAVITFYDSQSSDEVLAAVATRARDEWLANRQATRGPVDP